MANLTVVIPAYNSESTVAKSVRSAFAAGAVEVIVVDDGSIDDTAGVASVAGARVVTQSNAGAATARRTGVALAETDLVALLDADDELLPQGVEKSVNILTATESGAVGGAIIGRTRDGRRVAIRQWPTPLTTRDLLRTGHSPGAPGAYIWRREVLQLALGSLPPGLWTPFAEDYELLIRGSLLSVIELHDTPSLLYTLEGGKSTGDPTRSIRCSEEIRSHYSQLLGVGVRPVSERNMRGRGLVRAAKTFKAEGRTARWAWTLMQACVLDPRFFLALTRKGVWSRVKGLASRGELRAGS